MYVNHGTQEPMELRRDVKFPGTGVIGDHELPNMGTKPESSAREVKKTF